MKLKDVTADRGRETGKHGSPVYLLPGLPTPWSTCLLVHQLPVYLFPGLWPSLGGKEEEVGGLIDFVGVEIVAAPAANDVQVRPEHGCNCMMPGPAARGIDGGPALAG